MRELVKKLPIEIQRIALDQQFAKAGPPYDRELVTALKLGEDVSPVSGIIAAHMRTYLNLPDSEKNPNTAEASVLKNIRDIFIENLSPDEEERERLTKKFIPSKQDEAFLKSTSLHIATPAEPVSNIAIVSKPFADISTEYRRLIKAYATEDLPINSSEINTINAIVYDLICGPQERHIVTEPPYKLPLKEKVRRKIPGSLQEFHPVLRPQTDKEVVIFSQAHSTPVVEKVRRKIPGPLQEFHPALRPKKSKEEHHREAAITRLQAPSIYEDPSRFTDYSFYTMQSRGKRDELTYAKLPSGDFYFRILNDSQLRFLQNYFKAEQVTSDEKEKISTEYGKQFPRMKL